MAPNSAQSTMSVVSVSLDAVPGSTYAKSCMFYKRVASLTQRADGQPFGILARQGGRRAAQRVVQMSSTSIAILPDRTRSFRS